MTRQNIIPAFEEWGWNAQNLIARQSIGRHFWQEINCSTQNLSTARIQLILAQPDSSSWHFPKPLLNQLQFEQLIFFCLKVKLLEIHLWQTIFDLRPVHKKVTFARMVSSKWKIVSTIFFEQTNFEQLIMTPFEYYRSGVPNLFVNAYH